MKTKLILVFLFPIILAAQPKIERSVLNAGGGDYNGSNISISYSIGEIAVETVSTPTIILTQGFIQPDTLNKVDVPFDNPEFKVRVYPNPTVDGLTIEFPETEFAEFRYSLVDLKGETKIEGTAAGVIKQELDLSRCANGTYYLIIRINQEVRRVKIVKMD